MLSLCGWMVSTWFTCTYSMFMSYSRFTVRLVCFLDDVFISDGATSVLILRFYNSRNRVLVFVLYKMEATRVENMLQRG